MVNEFGFRNKKEKQKLLDILKISLKKIIDSIPNEVKLRTNELLNNIILINLRQSFDYYEDDEGNEKYKLRQCYGLDKLFKKIYDILEIHKININDLDSTNTTEELLSKISKNELLGKIESFHDFHINKKIETTKLILSYSYQDFFSFFMNNTRRIKLLEEINKLYKNEKIKDINIEEYF